MNFLRMCFDRRVLAALGIVAIGVWLVAPQAVLAALPLLVLALCPLSMAVMAWSMRGSPQGHAADPQTRLAALEREHAKLGEEISGARAELASANARPGQQAHQG